MTNEEQQLLLKVLCGMLPYGVKAQYYNAEDKRKDCDIIEYIYVSTGLPEIGIGQYGIYIDSIKPYLRPMSSMTEEEEKERNNIALFHSGNIASVPTYMDFLNKHHFDYHGLIKKGLALEAQEGMYKSE